MGKINVTVSSSSAFQIFSGMGESEKRRKKKRERRKEEEKE